jgi:hypothetical protein
MCIERTSAHDYSLAFAPYPLGTQLKMPLHTNTDQTMCITHFTITVIFDSRMLTILASNSDSPIHRATYLTKS